MVPEPARVARSRVWQARAILIGLFALFFVPIVVSMLLVIGKPGWTPFGSINAGELIQPPIELNLSDAVPVGDGQPLSRSADGHWLVAHPQRRAALPVVVSPAAPMIFRAWTPHSEMLPDQNGKK